MQIQFRFSIVVSLLVYVRRPIQKSSVVIYREILLHKLDSLQKQIFYNFFDFKRTQPLVWPATLKVALSHPLWLLKTWNSLYIQNLGNFMIYASSHRILFGITLRFTIMCRFNIVEWMSTTHLEFWKYFWRNFTRFLVKFISLSIISPCYISRLASNLHI